MKNVAVAIFKENGKEYKFSIPEKMELKIGQFAVVESTNKPPHAIVKIVNILNEDDIDFIPRKSIRCAIEDSELVNKHYEKQKNNMKNTKIAVAKFKESGKEYNFLIPEKMELEIGQFAIVESIIERPYAVVEIVDIINEDDIDFIPSKPICYAIENSELIKFSWVQLSKMGEKLYAYFSPSKNWILEMPNNVVLYDETKKEYFVVNMKTTYYNKLKIEIIKTFSEEQFEQYCLQYCSEIVYKLSFEDMRESEKEKLDFNIYINSEDDSLDFYMKNDYSEPNVKKIIKEKFDVKDDVIFIQYKNYIQEDIILDDDNDNWQWLNDFNLFDNVEEVKEKYFNREPEPETVVSYDYTYALIEKAKIKAIDKLGLIKTEYRKIQDIKATAFSYLACAYPYEEEIYDEEGNELDPIYEDSSIVYDVYIRSVYTS